MAKMTVFHGSYTPAERPRVIVGRMNALGPQTIAKIYELADVYHSDNIDDVADEFIGPLHGAKPLGYRQDIQAPDPGDQP